VDPNQFGVLFFVLREDGFPEHEVLAQMSYFDCVPNILILSITVAMRNPLLLTLFVDIDLIAKRL
jgi:hypothetical protein